MEKMKEFKTKDGFEVKLESFMIHDTYEGFMMGTKEIASERIKEKLEWKLEEFHLPNIEGTYINIPDIDVLPDWRVIAKLKSFKGVSEGDYSCLMACWFIDDTSESMDKIVEIETKNIMWAKDAKDNDWSNW